MLKFIGYLFVTCSLLAETLPRVDAPLRVDGDLSDPLWKQAVRIDRFYDIRSAANAEPPVKTAGWAAYDSRFLYIAFRAEDPAPGRIRAPHVPRDQVFGDQDLMQIDIDAQDDGKASAIFRVNARGVQTDGVYTEATGEDDFAPDFDFDSATRITGNAWEAELRIPLASIRYARRDPQTWRIVFYRVYPREHRYRLRSSPVRNGETCWLCSAPRFEGITGLGAAQSIVVTPYATTRAASSPGGPSERDADAGFDAKWLAGPSLSVDATLRPDFSQVEADQTQLTVNERFALFYPEKRPFFMEGADLLSSPLQAINTRTITSPLWGARLTGRPGKHAFTLIAAGDRGGGSTIVPGPVFSSSAAQPEALALLGRYRYSFGDSSAGLLLTSRGGDGASNRVFGPDVLWWPRRTDRVTAQLLFSDTRDAGSDRAAVAAWDRTATHYGWNVTLKEIGRDFRADSGFLPQTGIRALSIHPTATAYPKKPGLTQLVAGLQVDRVEDSDGDEVSRSIVPALFAEGWRGTTAEVRLHPGERLRAAGGSLQSQSYLTAAVRFLPSRRFPYLNLTARLGEEVDVASARVGRGTTLGATARLQPANPLYVEGSIQKHRLNVGGVPLFEALALSTRVTWAFTERSILRVILDGQRISQQNGRKRGFLDSTILYAYRLTWQTSLYLGYGDSRAVEPSGALARPEREVFLKASYAVRRILGNGE